MPHICHHGRIAESIISQIKTCCLLISNTIFNAQMAVVSDTEGPASSVTSGDDIVSVETLYNGTVNAIKLELELLPAVGEVSA